MNKSVYLAASAALLFALAGCSAPQGQIQSLVDTDAGTAPTSAASAEPEATEAPMVDDYYAGVPTGPGEICDINSMYTVECEKEYPEVGYLNGVRRVAVDLAQVSDETLLAYGRQACEQIAAGSAVQIESFDAVTNSVIENGAKLTLCR